MTQRARPPGTGALLANEIPQAFQARRAALLLPEEHHLISWHRG